VRGARAAERGRRKPTSRAPIDQLTLAESMPCRDFGPPGKDSEMRSILTLQREAMSTVRAQPSGSSPKTWAHFERALEVNWSVWNFMRLVSLDGLAGPGCRAALPES